MVKTKRCSGCEKVKSRASFHRQSSRADGLQNWCKACRKANDRERWIAGENRTLIELKQESRYRAYTRNREFIRAYKAARKCVDCGSKKKLEFDHVRGVKKFTIASRVTSAYSLETLKREIAKCDLRCNRCHIARHSKEGYGRTY